MEKTRFFFQPVKLHLQLANLLVQLPLHLLRFLCCLLRVIGKKLMQALQKSLLPFVNLIRVCRISHYSDQYLLKKITLLQTKN
jgi:hypothetical protein